MVQVPKKNDINAFKWFKQAAFQDDASAQINLGLMYQNKSTVAQNDFITWELSMKKELVLKKMKNLYQSYGKAAKRGSDQTIEKLKELEIK